MDKHMDILAKRHIETKFMKVSGRVELMPDNSSALAYDTFVAQLRHKQPSAQMVEQHMPSSTHLSLEHRMITTTLPMASRQLIPQQQLPGDHC